MLTKTLFIPLQGISREGRKLKRNILLEYKNNNIHFVQQYPQFCINCVIESAIKNAFIKQKS